MPERRCAGEAGGQPLHMEVFPGHALRFSQQQMSRGPR